MKRCLLLFLSLYLGLCGCTLSPTTLTPQSATPVSTDAPDLFDTPWEDRSIFRGGLLTSEQPVLDELANATVYHLELEIAADLVHLSGTEELRYTNTEGVALQEIHFRLFPNILGGQMTVSNLTVHGQAVSPRLEMEDSVMIVPLPQALEPGQSAILRMEFAVTVPQEVSLSYGVLAFFDNVLTLAHVYPMIAVYDDEGWNAEIPAQGGDVVYADASFFLVKITAPENVTLVTSGREIHTETDNGLQLLHVASGPARDFYLAASPDYKVLTEQAGEITIRSYAPQQRKDGARMAMDVARRALEVFSDRYAPYPYTELDIVATPTQALGIEYPGMIAITSRIYDVQQTGSDTSLSAYMEATVAHEVGHQWFYNLVGSDQLDDPWLDESLTQFATLQYFQDEYGPNGGRAFEQSLESRWDNVGRAEIPIGLPVADYMGPEYGAIVYGRGALFFMALQEHMGADAFDAFLKEYTATLSWKVATPGDLQSVAERHCSCDLDAIFDEWVYP